MAEGRADWELYAEKHYCRNFWFGVASGIVRNLAFLHPELVMPYFIGTLHPLKSLVGIWSGLDRVFSYIPQFFFAKWIQDIERRKKFYLYGCLAQVATFLVNVIFIAFFSKSHPIVVLIQYYIMTIARASAFALLYLAFLDIAGRMIPETKRGTYIGYSTVFSALIGFLGVAPIVQFILNRESLFPYPSNFVIFHGLQLIATLLAVVLFIPIREPVVPIIKRDVISLGEHFRRGFHYMRTDPKMRWFTINFALFQSVRAANSYGIRFITEDMKLDQTIIGSTLYTSLVSMVVGNFVFGFLGNRFGYRYVIRCCVGVFAPAYALLIFIPNLVKWLSGFDDGWSVEMLTRVLFHINVGLYWIGMGAFTIGQQNYMISMAPSARERPVYLSFPLMVILPIFWVYILWGWIVDVTNSYRFMFSLVMILIALSAVTSIIMPNERSTASEQ